MHMDSNSSRGREGLRRFSFTLSAKGPWPMPHSAASSTRLGMAMSPPTATT